MVIERCTLFTELSPDILKIENKFSLVDYRNNLYISNDLCRLFDFYDSFPNSESLINWMRERPHGKTTIYECPSNNDIVVIIPTSNFDGDLAKTCRDVIFKGLYLIFVESGFPKDNYFNYAYSCNVGIRRALELNPKKIIISNDDMKKIDDVSTLVQAIERSREDANVIWTKENKFLKHNFDLLAATLIFQLLIKVAKVSNFFLKSQRIRTLSLMKKFKIHLTPNYDNSKINHLSKILYRVIATYKVPGPFSIYSPDFIKSQGGMLFDETFINGFEDTWLGINIAIKNILCDQIDYKIRPIEGASLGRGPSRYLRNFANFALFNHYAKESHLNNRNINLTNKND